MARRPKPHSDAAAHLQDLQRLLADYADELKRPDLRERVRALVPSFAKLRELGISLMSEHTRNSARDRILAYFLRYPRTVIDGDELMVVSGISDWARRVRELRTEYGWLINSGTTFKDLAVDTADADGVASLAELEMALGRDPRSLHPEQYVLVSEVQDRDAAFRWKILNDIRKKKISVKDKILEYFLANTGKPIIGEELRYLAADRQEWPRRARELRTEEGWAVSTRMSGRPDLPVGVYVLEHDRQAEAHDRKIKDPVRVEVLKRDGFACRVCGWKRSMASPDDPRRFLELHHIVEHKDGGVNLAGNLVTLCNVDHDQVHRDPAAAKRVAELEL